MLRDVAFGYGTGYRIAGINLTIQTGEFLGIIGPNGGGKSTLLNLMTGFLRPEQGDVEFLGTSLDRWRRVDFAREVGVVLQREESLFPYSVREVIQMGRYAHEGGWIGGDSEEDRRIGERVAETCRVAPFLDRRLETLSGGERQRVFLARALAQCPKVLLLDEPTSALDLRYQKEMLSLLSGLNNPGGMTVVMILHDVNLAARFCSRIVGVGGGRITFDGPTASVLTESNLSSLFETEVVVTFADGIPKVDLRWD